jgi:valyl-tRNA synthetase
VRSVADPPRAYDHRAVEAGWSGRWSQAGLFAADDASTRPAFSVAMPPPSVSSPLHLGHALQAIVQDICARYHRMNGAEVLWLPGVDHAGIAGQDAVERELARSGLTKEAIGQRAFDVRVNQRDDHMIGTLMVQLGRLGVSVDRSRLRFTMDPGYQRAVRAAFVRLWDQGLVYRDLRVVNWCARCRCVVSDMELAWRERPAVRYVVQCQARGCSGDEDLPVSTTRPELLLVAATAVAVEGAGPRHRDLVGGHAVVPLTGRRIPIVVGPRAAPGAAPEAMAVTPGHNAEHWELAHYHGLPIRVGLGPDGRLVAPELPTYHGLLPAVARELALSELAATGAVLGTAVDTVQVGHCDRCAGEIEPLAMDQWFLAMAPLVQHAAGQAGSVRWHPGRYARVHRRWLEDLRDWCISRQLWVGHRIPVYACAQGHQFAVVDEPAACPTCGDSALTADPDVLDTWFAQALWSFATLGWPEDTPALRKFYPTSLTVVSGDVLRLGVSRMILVGLELTGKAPFADVVVTGVVQASDGRKMVAARGNTVRPDQVVGDQGADALRGWAAATATARQEARFDERQLTAFRRLADKLWHAHRLVLADPVADGPVAADASLAGRWVMSRLQWLIRTATDSVERYELHRAIDALHDFVRRDLCSHYLEAVKPRLRAGEPACRATAVQALDTVLRLLHPFLPFLTEELWHRLPGVRDFLVRVPWPRVDDRLLDPDAEARMCHILGLVHEVRAARQAAGAVARGGELRCAQPPDPESAALIEQLASVTLTDRTWPGIPLTAVAAWVGFPGTSTPTGARLASEERLTRQRDRSRARLADRRFLERAPAAVVESERHRLAKLEVTLAGLHRPRPL